MHRLSISALVAVIALASASAHAALPTGVATMFTSLTTDFNELLTDYVYPLVLVITGGLVLLGLVKRLIKKAV